MKNYRIVDMTEYELPGIVIEGASHKTAENKFKNGHPNSKRIAVIPESAITVIEVKPEVQKPKAKKEATPKNK